MQILVESNHLYRYETIKILSSNFIKTTDTKKLMIESRLVEKVNNASRSSIIWLGGCNWVIYALTLLSNLHIK